MSLSSAPQDEVGETDTPHLTTGVNPQQPLSSSFKTSSINGSGTTPRLLFTWDPYGHVGPTTASARCKDSGPQVPKQPEGDADAADDEEGRNPSIGGEECSTPSSTHNNNNSNANDAVPFTTTLATAPFASPTTAQPPLTISSLLSSNGGGSAGGGGGGSKTMRSPQLSFNVAVHTPHQQPSGDTVSAHSTPSGPVLKRISTSAKDGRQYFLDYSPTTVANANPTGLVGAMPNLMLPPNLSPYSRGVSPLNSALPQPSQSHAQQQQQQHLYQHAQQQQHRIQMEMDLVEVEHHAGSATTSPQAIPLVSPPRSSSIGGVVNTGQYAYNPSSFINHHGVNYNNYGPTSVSVGSAGGGGGSTTQRNPYRTSPTFYATPTNMTANSNAAPPARSTNTFTTTPVLVQRVQTADLDADLYETLEITPSLFIKRLLPPPPPLPDVARVLPTPGVVQTLCERWYSFVEAVLRSREFSDVTTTPPPPPPIPSPTDTSPTGANPVANNEEESDLITSVTTKANSAAHDELRAWYNAALEWYEQLDQAGAATVDIRNLSKTVTWAIEAVSSDRGRRGGATLNSNNNGRYHGQGGAAGGSRGGGGASGSSMGGYRGSRSGAMANFYISNSNNIRSAAAEMEAAVNNSSNIRNTAYTSNFNPYAESWTFSGDTQLSRQGAPLPHLSAKQSYIPKVPSPEQQGHAANPAMGQI